MLWMGRPPYHRWLAAVLLVAAAFAWDLRAERAVPYPFAAADVDAGRPIVPELVEWRRVPAGVLPPTDPTGTRAAVPIPAGTPLLASLLTATSPIPAGWWSVPVALGSDVPAGTAVRLVLVDDGRTVPGIVAASGRADDLGGVEVGLVAVDERDAPDVAVASARGSVVVLVAP